MATTKKPRVKEKKPPKPQPIPDKNGWIAFPEFQPNEFELVKVLTENEKCYTAWWNRRYFEGARLPDDAVIIKWKKSKESFPIYHS